MSFSGSNSLLDSVGVLIWGWVDVKIIYGERNDLFCINGTNILIILYRFDLHIESINFTGFWWNRVG